MSWRSQRRKTPEGLKGKRANQAKQTKGKKDGDHPHRQPCVCVSPNPIFHCKGELPGACVRVLAPWCWSLLPRCEREFGAAPMATLTLVSCLFPPPVFSPSLRYPRAILYTHDSIESGNASLGGAQTRRSAPPSRLLDADVTSHCHHLFLRGFCFACAMTRLFSTLFSPLLDLLFCLFVGF